MVHYSVGGKGIMHRSAVRWGQGHGPGLLQSLFFIIKVEEMRKFWDWLPIVLSSGQTLGGKKLKMK